GRDGADVAPAQPDAEERGAPRVALAADVARRAAAGVEPPVPADDDVVLLVEPVREMGDDRTPRCRGTVVEADRADPAGDGHEERPAPPGEPERDRQPALERPYPAGREVDRDDGADVLRHVEP